MKSNPFSLMFGKEPENLIERITQTRQITDSFLSEAPPIMLYMITGVRGSGKTVFMTDVSGRVAGESDWIVAELNPERDLIEGLMHSLWKERGLPAMFKADRINLSFLGLGVEIADAPPVTDSELAVRDMLLSLKKRNKRILITIDEVTNTKDMRVFASAYQIFIRQKLPVFLLMTGLYENIDALQNDKALTFLHRAPKIRLEPLNIGRISAYYQETFSLADEDARAMARATKGYPFAFQVLGYYTFESGGDYKKAIPQTRQYLEENVYNKLWSELSATDRRVLMGVADEGSGQISAIRECLGMKPNEFSPYRSRLTRKGVLNGDTHGYVTMALPFFREFVLENYDIEHLS